MHSATPLTVAPATAPPGSLEDLDSVTLLRQRVTKEMDGWGAEEAVEAAALLDDFTLQRYLMARPEGLEAALTMIRESCRWRVARGISRLCCELHPEAPADCRHRWHAQARAFFYGGVGGTARDGTPYFVERLGKADLAGFSAEPNILNLMLDAYAAHLELLFRTVRLRSAETGTFVKTTLVIDASELSLSTLRHISVVKQVCACPQRQYPMLRAGPAMLVASWARHASGGESVRRAAGIMSEGRCRLVRDSVKPNDQQPAACAGPCRRPLPSGRPTFPRACSACLS